MTTPLQSARRKEGWSQARAVWELVRLAKSKGVTVATPQSLKTQLSRWENGHIAPDFYRDLLCQLYKASPRDLGFGTQQLPYADTENDDRSVALISKKTWTRADLSLLSENFDEAVSSSAVADIEMLAHEWLNADKPQLVELDSGRKVGVALIGVVEHRVIQLRRADDFISGRASHALVRAELGATTTLLKEASLTDSQARKLLTATGELAQLASWVAADAGLHKEAASYVRGGVLAAHAADDQPLAGNIISTLSYQLANTGNPREAAMLARTAFAGARHHATASTRALLMEPVAWADAKCGDAASCKRSLGVVEDHFSHAAPEDDPDWVYWLNREEVDVMAGRCYTELRLPSLAEPLLRAATDAYDDTMMRENSLYLSWLAEDYILLGEIDQAAKLAMEILQLATRVDSARTDERLRHLAKLLKRYKNVQSVAEFLDMYRQPIA